MDAIEPSTVAKALDDPSRDVRVSALQLSERWLGEHGNPLQAAVFKKLDDPDWAVRHQFAATHRRRAAGHAGRETTALTLLERFGNDPLTVDAVLSGSRGTEAPSSSGFSRPLTRRRSGPPPSRRSLRLS